MNAMQLRRLFSRSRSRIALLLAVAALGSAMMAHHTPLAMHGMAGSAGIAMCLAVLGAAVFVAARGLSFIPRTRTRLVSTRVLRALWVPPVRGAPARAGPIYLYLRVLRR